MAQLIPVNRQGRTLIKSALITALRDAKDRQFYYDKHIRPLITQQIINEAAGWTIMPSALDCAVMVLSPAHSVPDSDTNVLKANPHLVINAPNARRFVWTANGKNHSDIPSPLAARINEAMTESNTLCPVILTDQLVTLPGARVQREGELFLYSSADDTVTSHEAFIDRMKRPPTLSLAKHFWAVADAHRKAEGQDYKVQQSLIRQALRGGDINKAWAHYNEGKIQKDLRGRLLRFSVLALRAKVERESLGRLVTNELRAETNESELPALATNAQRLIDEAAAAVVGEKAKTSESAQKALAKQSRERQQTYQHIAEEIIPALRHRFAYLRLGMSVKGQEYGRWLVFSGYVWREDEKGRIALEVSKHVNSRVKYYEGKNDEEAIALFKTYTECQSAGNIKKLVDQLALNFELNNGEANPLIFVPDDFDEAGEGVLPIGNGYLLFDEGTVTLDTTADPERYLLHGSDLEYRPDETSVEWLNNRLAEIFANAERRDWILSMLAINLTGMNYQRKFIILCGQGNNGKSVVVRLLHDVFGSYGGTMKYRQLVRTKNIGGTATAANSELVDLANCRIVGCSEADDKDVFDAAKIKTILGDDYTKERRLYEADKEFIPRFSIVLATNTKPQVYDASTGWWKRVIEVPMRQQFQEDDEVKKRFDKVETSEAMLVLLVKAWQRCHDWQELKRTMPADIREAIADYQEQEDLIGEWIEACLTINLDEVNNSSWQVPSAALQRCFNGWCDEEGRKVNISTKKLSQTFLAKGCKSGRGSGAQKGKRTIRGLRLKSSAIGFIGNLQAGLEFDEDNKEQDIALINEL